MPPARKDRASPNASVASNKAAKTALFDEFARVGQALANGRRVEILDVLANGERTVESLALEVGLTLANTSQHLQVLGHAGLVRRRRDGTFIHYCLVDGSVFELWRAMRSVAALHRAEIDQLAVAYLGGRDALEPLTREALNRRLRAGEDLVVIDVRPRQEFAAGHLPDAVSLPIGELRRRLRELPKDKEIVAYCRGPYCAFAHTALKVLRQGGYQARRLEDGLPEWRAAGLPIAIGDRRP